MLPPVLLRRSGEVEEWVVVVLAVDVRVGEWPCLLPKRPWLCRGGSSTTGWRWGTGSGSAWREKRPMVFVF